jgi:hypothetical protein
VAASSVLFASLDLSGSDCDIVQFDLVADFEEEGDA